jgi:23S rRNA G2069 N7-methylase RlmK/C1962 C5-methylase RlmI
MKPCAEFVKRYLANSKISIDPFARNCDWATYTNDINPHTSAQHHLDAIEYLKLLYSQGVKSDLIILDAPYTCRQISECYKEIGIKVTQKHTQIGSFYKDIKDAADSIISPNGIVLTFGYSSVGMGIKRGYKIEEIRLVAQGGPHFDVICVAERKT